MENNVLIEMRNIRKTFPGVVALDNAQLTLRKGEIHALMGENGAGKSTIIKCLTGVYERDSGDVFMDGVEGNIHNHSTMDAQNIGIATAKTQTMVLFKRGFAGTISEWLAATEYITQCGNDNVVLCERGLRTFESATRFTLDISAVPVIHKQSLFPICLDVSHPAGQRDLVPSLAKAAVAVGADAIMIEVHPDPQKALSDGAQQLTPDQFADLVAELREIAAVFGKKIV